MPFNLIFKPRRIFLTVTSHSVTPTESRHLKKKNLNKERNGKGAEKKVTSV